MRHMMPAFQAFVKHPACVHFYLENFCSNSCEIFFHLLSCCNMAAPFSRRECVIAVHSHALQP